MEIVNDQTFFCVNIFTLISKIIKELKSIKYFLYILLK